MTDNERYIYRCLQLATIGKGRVAPNPMVGCVIVHNNIIIGEGAHQNYGEPHAERQAILSVKNKKLLAEATLYVNLEPCCHHGKTPPCTDIILEYQIPKVVIGSQDPNPKMNGKSITLLQENGIEVISGVLEEICKDFNRYFYCYHTLQRPYIILKWAETDDGFIDKIRTADTPPLKISDSTAQLYNHKLRSEISAILVGYNTVIMDNPQLTVRHWSGKNPLRLVLDQHEEFILNLDKYRNCHLFQKNSNTLILGKSGMYDVRIEEYTTFKPSVDNLHLIEHWCKILRQQRINSIIVEGGAKTIQYFIQQNIWDEAVIFRNKERIFNGVKAPTLPNEKVVTRTKIGNGEMIFIENK